MEIYLNKRAGTSRAARRGLAAALALALACSSVSLESARAAGQSLPRPAETFDLTLMDVGTAAAIPLGELEAGPAPAAPSEFGALALTISQAGATGMSLGRLLVPVAADVRPSPVRVRARRARRARAALRVLAFADASAGTPGKIRSAAAVSNAVFHGAVAARREILLTSAGPVRVRADGGLRLEHPDPARAPRPVPSVARRTARAGPGPDVLAAAALAVFAVGLLHYFGVLPHEAAHGVQLASLLPVGRLDAAGELPDEHEGRVVPLRRHAGGDRDRAAEDHQDAAAGRFEAGGPAGETIRNVVLGMADGLTVPFALAAGLAGAAASSRLVTAAGLAEIAAGAVAMGLGAYLAARGDVERYAADLERESGAAARAFAAREEAAEILHAQGLRGAEIEEMLKVFEGNPAFRAKVMMHFKRGWGEAPASGRAWGAVLAVGGAYAVGGLVSLLPYFVVPDVRSALPWSAAVTLAALCVFGWFRGLLTSGRPWRSALETTFVGALAAAAAFALARLAG